jgi:hypothetical protein
MWTQLARVLPRRGLVQVGAHEAEDDALEVDTRLGRLHVRDEYPRGRVRGLRRPLFWRGEREDARPCGERGYDLERFGKRTGTVAV